MKTCIFLRCWLAAVVVLAGFLGSGLALATVAVPSLTARVTDLTHSLSTQQTQQLDAKLAALEQRKGAQLVLLLVPTTQPDAITDYATRVFEQWKLGRHGVDDGLLLLVAKDDRRVMIETGYGLEGAVPDAAAARIIREYLAPKFRVNDYYGGLDDAVGALTLLIDGEALPPPVQGPEGGGTPAPDWFNGMLVAGFVMLVARGLFARLQRMPRAGLVASASGLVAWLFSGLWVIGLVLAVVGLVFGLLESSGGSFARRGGFGGWGGGGLGGGGFGGGGGGLGGGGFSGGGGMTGGGGASGSW